MKVSRPIFSGLGLGLEHYFRGLGLEVLWSWSRTVKTGLETGLFFDTPCKPFGCFLKHVLLLPLSDAIDSGLSRNCEVRKLFRVAT